MKRRILIGSIFSIGGFVLTLIPLFISNKQSYLSWIYGIPLLIIGLIILFNKKEDKIEEINYKGGKK